MKPSYYIQSASQGDQAQTAGTRNQDNSYRPDVQRQQTISGVYPNIMSNPGVQQVQYNPAFVNPMNPTVNPTAGFPYYMYPEMYPEQVRTGQVPIDHSMYNYPMSMPIMGMLPTGYATIQNPYRYYNMSQSLSAMDLESRRATASTPELARSQMQERIVSQQQAAGSMQSTPNSSIPKKVVMENSPIPVKVEMDRAANPNWTAGSTEKRPSPTSISSNSLDANLARNKEITKNMNDEQAVQLLLQISSMKEMPGSFGNMQANKRPMMPSPLSKRVNVGNASDVPSNVYPFTNPAMQLKSNIPQASISQNNGEIYPGTYYVYCTHCHTANPINMNEPLPELCKCLNCKLISPIDTHLFNKNLDMMATMQGDPSVKKENAAVQEASTPVQSTLPVQITAKKETDKVMEQTQAPQQNIKIEPKTEKVESEESSSILSIDKIVFQSTDAITAGEIQLLAERPDLAPSTDIPITARDIQSLQDQCKQCPQNWWIGKYVKLHLEDGDENGGSEGVGMISSVDENGFHVQLVSEEKHSVVIDSLQNSKYKCRLLLNEDYFNLPIC